MTARDVVFTFFHENWPDAVRRQFMPPDRLVQTLLNHDRVGGLLVANPYRSAPRLLARRILATAADPPFPRRTSTELTTPLRLRKRDPVGEGVLRRTYEAYDRHLQARAKHLGLDRPVVITTNPFYAAFAPLDWAGPVTYYAWDDWAALASLQRWWDDFDTAYRTLSERGVRVCAVTDNLLRRIEPTAAAAVVPNGVVPSEWQPPWEAPAWLEPLPRPRILYVGAIHERLDMNAVREISQHFSAGSIVVVGPVANTEVVKQLTALPNVHVKEPLSHSQIAGLMHAADVCIMPHHRNALTESMSPLKIYEYCSAGRPVVATDLPAVRGVSDRVRLVPTGSSFVPAVEEALSDGPMPEAERTGFLQRNSWQGRHEQILDLALA